MQGMMCKSDIVYPICTMYAWGTLSDTVYPICTMYAWGTLNFHFMSWNINDSFPIYGRGRLDLNKIVIQVFEDQVLVSSNT